MNVRCPTCETVYRVDPAKIPSGGTRARCGVCAGVIPISAKDAVPVAAAVPVAPIRPPMPAPAATAPAPAPPEAPPIREPAPEPEPEPTPPPPPLPAAAEQRVPTRRVTAPFFQPRRSEHIAPPAPLSRPPAPTAPSVTPRPSAPVFRPTPGTPLTSTPAAPPPAPSRPSAAPARPKPPQAPAPKAATPVGGGFVNPFLAQDPRQKARRLARALVSDMIVYQPEKRQQALAAGTVKDAFGEEIKKSWEEYVDQIGEEIASSTPYWTEALNDILAGGQQIF